MTNRGRNFTYITLADFLVRSAYQIGKTPLLPLFAASLGAGDAFLGFIVSVSTLTGMVLKPFVGIFSDRWGRRAWLIAGTFFFAVVPFFYHFVHSPEQLFLIRIVHGLATAIYGPVTLAYVAEQTQRRRAEKLGLFSMARSAGYIVGPAAAGWLLLTMDPVAVFTIIGVLSMVAFVPVMLLAESLPVVLQKQRVPIRRQIASAIKAGSRTPAVWLSGGLEATMFVALYTIKAFLPVYTLAAGINVALVGLFFALQEAVHLLLKPFGGRFGDRVGHLKAVYLGMALLGLMLPILTWTHSSLVLLIVAAMMGLAQAFVFPSTVALISTQVTQNNLAAGMGILGTLQNAGKVAGPVIGGFLISWFGFSRTVQLMGLGLLVAALMIWLINSFNRRLPTGAARPSRL